MSDLSTLLRAHRGAILAAFGQRLKKAAADRALDIPDDGALLLDAVLDLLENGQSSKGRTWIEMHRDELNEGRVDGAAMLARLALLEDVLRFHIVKESAHRKDIFTALGQAAVVVDAIRRRGATATAAQLQEALEESEIRKRAILESSLDPIITIDHRGVITEFNRAAEHVFGRKRAEVLGTEPSEILFPPSKIAGYQNRIDRYLNAGEGSLLSKRTEVVAVRANGLPFEAELTMTINQERGTPVLTFFVRDISARKRAEEEQRRYAQDLERSNRELEQFAYVASHDLQEPLRKIRTFGDRLATHCGESLDEQGRECIVRMQHAAERMQSLINDLLILSRVSTKATDFDAVDLTKVAQEVVADLEVKIEQTGSRVEVGPLPTIQADPLQMRQLLQNLVGNALKFHEEGQTPVVAISGKQLRPGERLAGGTLAQRDTCQIAVRDNGIGFDEKYLDRIFDVFQRLHPRDVYEGTGVGLAICRKIVDRHGGAITARSRPGEGATFLVELPVGQHGIRGVQRPH